MRLPFVTMRSSRTAAAVALVAATVIAMPSATAVSSAPARGAAPGDWTGPVIEIWQKAYWLSPNGDRVQDKTRIEFSLDKPAKVTVKVRRQNERRTLVYKEELGRFVGNSSENIWTWKGKDGHGDVVRDGRYTAIFVAEQIGPDGKKRARSTNVYVDTRFDPPKAPVLSVDTLYPRTTQIQDALAVTLAKRGPMASVSWAELRVRDSRGGAGAHDRRQH